MKIFLTKNLRFPIQLIYLMLIESSTVARTFNIPLPDIYMSYRVRGTSLVVATRQ